jgi:hypothetical protein
MTDMDSILSEVAKAADPVAVIRKHVLAQGGVWADETPISGLFEIQLAGLIGIGPSAPTAAEDWIMQARQRNAA